MFDPGIVKEIERIKINQEADEVRWSLNHGKKFTIKSFINHMRGEHAKDNMFQYLWEQTVPPRIAIHNWKLWKELLPVDDILKMRMQIPIVSCS